jgi:hypothetical protein
MGRKGKREASEHMHIYAKAAYTRVEEKDKLQTCMRA